MELTINDTRRKSLFRQSSNSQRSRSKGCESPDKNMPADPSRGWIFDFESKLAREQLKEKDIWRKTEREVIAIISPFEKEYKKAKERIEELCNVDSPDAPNQIARELALEALKLLWTYKITPSLINPSGDESLFFEFFVKDDYYLFKFCNSGEIVYLKRIVGQPKIVKEINTQQLEEATKEITSAYGNADV